MKACVHRIDQHSLVYMVGDAYYTDTILLHIQSVRLLYVLHSCPLLLIFINRSLPDFAQQHRSGSRYIKLWEINSYLVFRREFSGIQVELTE